jgi:hypothetical protein
VDTPQDKLSRLGFAASEEVRDDIPSAECPSRAHGISALKAQAEYVYCDVQMTATQARDFLKLVQSLRQAGQHLSLEPVLRGIEEEVTASLDNLILFGSRDA